MARWVERLTLGFSSGRDVRVMRSSGTLLAILCPSLTLPAARSLSFSLKSKGDDNAHQIGSEVSISLCLLGLLRSFF